MSIDLQKFSCTILGQHIISLNHEFLHSSLIEAPSLDFTVSFFVHYLKQMHFCSATYRCTLTGMHSVALIFQSI